MKAFLFSLIAVMAASTAWGETTKQCEDMAGVKLDHAVVQRAAVASRAELAEMKLRGAETLPAFCRVQIVDRPSTDSDVKTEVWLPLEGWNGRLRAQGNGGFAGDISFGGLAETVRQGYAAVGTDTGHVGGKGDFALGHPEKVKDFGWRAVHDMTVQAKEVIKAFYGKAQEKAYFTSCSDGGREALMEAQRFPADYDGILAGAPAYNWTGLLSGAAESRHWIETQAGSALPAEKIPALAAAVRAACDAKDGVKDGILNDPRTCGFDPATMACKAGDAKDSTACLTPPQVETVKRLYRGTVDDAGKVVFPGLMPGAEEGQNGWTRWITGDDKDAAMAFYSKGYFSNFIFDDPAWTAKGFDFDRDYKLALAKTAVALDSTDANLTPFVSRGGKLILYHGWNDPGIPALMTVDYYNAAVEKIGKGAADESVRLYMVPGMQHCAEGPGATEFGQGMGKRGDREHDVFTALETWVEKGSAPEVLTAEKTEGKGAEKKVVMERPLCPYPQVAKYDGKGDTAKAASFACAGK
ncbi:MAG: tannase/feruloyl esterase family alpha/beta hydrolase [Acidobacteria bacterium]|nr:tannase/feruloyl esterase family alpha/beta hydrolase [Acidobacteriota bacterium]